MLLLYVRFYDHILIKELWNIPRLVLEHIIVKISIFIIGKAASIFPVWFVFTFVKEKEVGFPLAFLFVKQFLTSLLTNVPSSSCCAPLSIVKGLVNILNFQRNQILKWHKLISKIVILYYVTAPIRKQFTRIDF